MPILKRKDAGFTLIEILIVACLLGMSIAGSTGILTMILRNNQKTEGVLSVRQEGDNVISKINRIIAESINMPYFDTECSALEPKIITIQKSDKSIVEIACTKLNDEDVNYENVMLGTAALIDRSGKNLTIQSCAFSCYKNKYGSFSVDFNLSLADASNMTREFSITTVMRNTKP